MSHNGPDPITPIWRSWSRVTPDRAIVAFPRNSTERRPVHPVSTADRGTTLFVTDAPAMPYTPARHLYVERDDSVLHDCA